MSKICRVAAAALTLTLVVSALAQVKVAVGDALVNGGRLQPFKNEWGMKVIKPDGTVLPNVGTWTDEMEAVEVGERPCWKRTQHATYKRQNGEVAMTNTTVNVFDRKTFAPVSREFGKRENKGESSGTKITFGEHSMKVENTENGKTEVKELPASYAFDFYGGIYAVLWAALPLRDGFSATFPSYAEDEHPEVVTPVTYKVVGHETTEAGARGKVDAWVVESDGTIGHLKYWVSKDAPYVIRMDYTQKNGALWVLTMN